MNSRTNAITQEHAVTITVAGALAAVSSEPIHAASSDIVDINSSGHRGKLSYIDGCLMRLLMKCPATTELSGSHHEVASCCQKVRRYIGYLYPGVPVIAGGLRRTQATNNQHMPGRRTWGRGTEQEKRRKDKHRWHKPDGT
jgi:hypothetical protein